ncbi:hypothetical protein JIG36_36070 [Actinoplanes sp. LDG1-06]|uniref:Sox C-terminal domain-containing protein n=1 Tax=Paractinoplanes ovalisporus TaxID=2810368 RepID=A0ABS2ANW2_9ACTN|nr:hypothetical protein [Actinoplanes ovalisporus]MBM2620931.1 hypothetical protein [Actinoplanes ovalisporus]
MSSPPPMSNPDDMDSLVVEVAYYENLGSLDRDDFDRYVRAEATLENMISAEAARRQKDFGFAEAEELLDQFLALNTSQRDIAERERARPGLDDDYRRQLDYIGAATAGNILLAEGQQHANRAEQRRLASDYDSAEKHLREAMRCFAQLARSDVPLQPVGELRYTLSEATGQMMAGLAHMRAGDFKGAYQSLDRTHVAFDELLAQAEEEHARAGDANDPQFEELRRDLADSMRYVQAVQSFAEVLREAQNGNYRDAVVSGQEAVAHFERIVAEAVARQASRNAHSLFEMELARVNGWLSWVSGELAVDEGRWAACREHIRAARGHWNRAARAATRNFYMGIIAQRPEDGNTDMLLQSTLRRCDRELAFRMEIDALNAKLTHSNRIEIQAVGQGGNAMPSSSNFNFNAPVSSNIIGNEARIESATANQANASTDLRELTRQLADLREVLAGAARTPQERETVEAVTAAHEAAGRNDEEATRTNLARAGKWALGVAEQLALAAATAAIKLAMGA